MTILVILASLVLNQMIRKSFRSFFNYQKYENKQIIFYLQNHNYPRKKFGCLIKLKQSKTGEAPQVSRWYDVLCEQ